ncbi:MAG: hypothetical protein Q7S40_19255 [Opitutaceae bacterium]|nr:hypothetical protein [Opitutaceae bacterium]
MKLIFVIGPLLALSPLVAAEDAGRLIFQDEYRETAEGSFR